MPNASFGIKSKRIGNKAKVQEQGGQCVSSWRLRPLGVRVLSYDLSNSFFSMKARGMEAMLDLVVFEFLYCADVFVFVFG